MGTETYDNFVLVLQKKVFYKDTLRNIVEITQHLGNTIVIL